MFLRKSHLLCLVNGMIVRCVVCVFVMCCVSKLRQPQQKLYDSIVFAYSSAIRFLHTHTYAKMHYSAFQYLIYRKENMWSIMLLRFHMHTPIHIREKQQCELQIRSICISLEIQINSTIEVNKQQHAREEIEEEKNGNERKKIVEINKKNVLSSVSKCWLQHTEEDTKNALVYQQKTCNILLACRQISQYIYNCGLFPAAFAFYYFFAVFFLFAFFSLQKQFLS